MIHKPYKSEPTIFSPPKDHLNLVSKFDNEFPDKNFKSFLEYIQITEETFFKKIDELRSAHLWEFKNGKWSLKHKCF